MYEKLDKMGCATVLTRFFRITNYPAGTTSQSPAAVISEAPAVPERPQPRSKEWQLSPRAILQPPPPPPPGPSRPLSPCPLLQPPPPPPPGPARPRSPRPLLQPPAPPGPAACSTSQHGGAELYKAGFDYAATKPDELR
jgi:hypothetical protein